MKISALYRRALTICAVAAVLAGCDGTQPPIGAPSDDVSQTARHHEIFRYTGSEQKFKVPAQVTEITVVALGASEGYGSSSGYATEAPGGEVKATIPVNPHETLYVFVGGRGGMRFANIGGYNGGGSGGYGASGYIPGWGGDGASDIRQGGNALSNRIVVAGGGGGAAFKAFQGGSGGAGGGKIGASGGSSGSGSYASGGGGGGAQKSGGAGGAGPVGSCPGGAGESGTLGQGGDGGDSCAYLGSSGGGGGGGYYGGGGGGGAGCYTACGSDIRFGDGGGGGGGSSYVEKKARRVTNSQGTARRGDGKITVYWVSH
ncbi:MAG: glycine-rich protein [Candidatus Cybelea sp.]